MRTRGLELVHDVWAAQEVSSGQLRSAETVPGCCTLLLHMAGAEVIPSVGHPAGYARFSGGGKGLPKAERSEPLTVPEVRA